MATWLAGHAPWLLPLRANVLPSRLWSQTRTHLNIALQTPSPASLEIESMPYPTALPDTSVFESLSEEYASMSAPGRHKFTPLTPSDTLASLVSKRDFSAAESLRKELVTHHISIPRNVLYLRVALHAITQHRQRTPTERLEAFAAWLSLAPDRHEAWQSFHDIRQRLFCSMDHLNLTLVYRFGLVLASKGYYSGDAAIQVVSTLTRYSRPSVVERYLRQVEDASREYHLKLGTALPSDSLAGVYNLSVRTVALGGKAEAALSLISTAHSRGIQISDFTLNIVAKHATDRLTVIDRIQAMYPSWSLQDTNAYPITVACETIPTEHTADVAALAARLRALRIALRSPRTHSPHALQSFITSYQSLGRTRAISLLRVLAYRHSPKSASTWAFTAMLHHRSRREPLHLLFVFSQHFYLVGVPRKTLLSLIRGPRGQQARKEHFPCWITGPRPMHAKLWPSAYHTALVWEALVLLSPRTERERLYVLLVSLVQRSRRPEEEHDRGWERGQGWDADRVELTLSPDAYDAAHFSPFVSAWARKRPARAASILKDMVELGVQPTMVQWSMVARGYAQHDDPLVALRILDQLEEMESGRGQGQDDEMGGGKGRGEGEGEGDGEGELGERPSDALLGVHTNVLRGFVVAGDVQRAREVERRLVERLGYQVGDRPATDASIALLRGLEGTGP